MKKNIFFVLAVFFVTMTTVSANEKADILHFRNSEIMEIIKKSKEFNPDITDMNKIKTGQYITIYLGESMYFSKKVLSGDSFWKILNEGIPKNKIEYFFRYKFFNFLHCQVFLKIREPKYLCHVLVWTPL
jgi:hypothetical protein